MATKRILFPGFSGGLGHKVHDPNAAGYGIATNTITRFGPAYNGLAEVVDRTGIAAGYQVVKQIKHRDVNVVITYNGTNSKLYQQESAVWTERDSVNSVRCRDVISFHDGTDQIIAWCFGADTAFRYNLTLAVGVAGTWTASTITTIDNAKFFLNQQNNLSGPRVLIAVDPNELYFAASLVNTATVSTSSEIGDASAQNYWTCLVQNATGVVYCGQRHDLWAYANGPVVHVLGPYNDPPGSDTAPTGNLGHRLNFENPQMLSSGMLVFQVEGADLVGLMPDGTPVPELAPRWTPRNNGFTLPRLELPINCMLAVGDFLIVALGSGDTATSRTVVGQPGGSNLLQNTFATTSEIYVAVIVGDRLVWHGSELTCTDILRYMWFDEDDGYLYMASAGTELINEQQRRCYFFLTEPSITLETRGSTDLTTIPLNTTTPAIIETAIVGGDDPFDHDRPLHVKAVVTGLAVGGDNMALVGSDLTERSTAVTGADTELSSVTGLSISQGTPVMIVFKYRKGAGAASAARFGLKINGTVIWSAINATANFIISTGGTNEAQSGMATMWLWPGDTGYTGGLNGNYNCNGATGAAGQAIVASGVQSNPIPIATITSITITGDAVNGAQTIYTDDLRIYTLA